MSDTKLNDEIFDALLKEALSQLEEEKVKEKNRELEQIDTSDYVPSKKFLRNLRREYFRYSVKNTLKSKALRKVASFVLMAGVVSGGLCFWAEANGIPVYETIFLRKERYTSIEVYNQIVSEEDESSLDYFYFPKYLPVDFQVVEEVSDKEFYYIMTSAEESDTVMDCTLECLRGLAKCLKGSVERGVIYGKGVYAAGEIESRPAMQEAYEMGRRV